MRRRGKITGLIITAAALAGMLAGCKLLGVRTTTPTQMGGKASVHGVLSYLNYSEKDYDEALVGSRDMLQLLEDRGYWISKYEEDPSDDGIRIIRYYDSLDAMILALESGNLEMIDEMPQSTAMYLCYNNDKLCMPYRFDFSKERDPEGFEQDVLDRMCNGFSFMLTEENEALRDELNEAISAMKEDGTLDRLVEEHITYVTEGDACVPIEIEKKEGRDTLKVAVTGSLPPMDYVEADGSFAGFNTAVLAEIGKRLDKNVELIQVDSVGRATALAAGTVDVVFWTRIRALGNDSADLTDSEYAASLEKREAGYTAEEQNAIKVYEEAVGSADKQLKKDIPDGCIITMPYFRDMSVPVMTRETFDRLNQAE